MTVHQPTVEGVGFKELPEFPGYCFGDDGSVWTRKQRGRWGVMLDRWRALKLQQNPRTPYLQIIVTNSDGKAVTRTVHVFICTAFHGPKPEGMEVCHRDGDPRNNRADNLRWGTRSDNMQDALGHGTFVIGISHHNAKLTDDEVADIAWFRHQGWTQARIAAVFGVTQTHVKDILKGRRRAKGAR